MNSAPTRWRLLAGALATMVLASLVILPATPARADGGTVGVAIAPVNAKGKGDGRSRFSYQVDPGQEITDQVRISNVGTTKLKVTVFATDAYNADNGDFALLDSAEKPTDAGSWVRFGGKKKLKLTLERGTSKVVPFTVKVPANATPGDHAAGVLAAAAESGDLTVERRIANRMYVRVSGDLQPSLTISSVSGVHHGGLNPADGSASVTATITNNGNVALEGVLTLSASTWFGIGLGSPSRQELTEILPGNTRVVNLEYPGVPQVGYANVNLLLQSGIAGDAPNPGRLPVVQRDIFVVAIPWAIVGVLLLTLGGWLILRRRRAREERLAEQWLAYHEGLRQAGEAESPSPVLDGSAVAGAPRTADGESPGESR